MIRIDADWLNEADTQSVLSVLSDAGHAAYAVGGCVRNTLLGVPVTDVDIATSATPEAVTDLVTAAGLRAVPTGIDHGTVTVVAPGRAFEVTTFRHDVETDGRRAVVAFTDDLTQDARRRDFTMNTLYADADGQVHDPVGGLDDLEARRVRFVGDARTRIREDYLRILRFFRFHAQYGDPAQGLDPDALDAIARSLDGLAGLSAERVGAEMKKLLAAPDPAPALGAMEAAGVLSAVLPGASPQFVAPLVHLESTLGVSPDAMRRLAAIADVGAADRFRLSRAETKALARLRSLMSGPEGLPEIAWRDGPKVAWDMCLLRAALADQTVPAGAAAQIETGAVARLPIAARDLMPEFDGPALGDALARAERAWIDSGFALGREALISVARERG